MLENFRVARDGKAVQTSLALNDVVLPRGGAGQMIEFEVFINEEFVYTQRSDGLIISTPPAPPPIRSPPAAHFEASLRAFTFVPICPQSMTNRPIAVSDTCEIEILVTKDRRCPPAFRRPIDLSTCKTSTASISAATATACACCTRAITNTTKTLRQKLHWGEQLIKATKKGRLKAYSDGLIFIKINTQYKTIRKNQTRYIKSYSKLRKILVIMVVVK